MLSLLPEQVKIERAVREYPQGLPENSLLTMEGKLPFAWLTKELNKSGVMGLLFLTILAIWIRKKAVLSER